VCHSDESRPPIAAGAGPAVPAQPLILEATDGNRFAAHAARPLAPSGVGVVVLPDVRGLHDYYRALVERFAEISVNAVAVDYFGRTAGTHARPESFDFRRHAQQTTAEGVASDVAAAIRYLRSPEGGGASSVFTVGFCFGGGHSWRLAGELDGLAGAVGFYGRPALAEDVVGRGHPPLLLLAAGADAQIPVPDVERFADSVRAAGGEAELVVYEGAPHSFFDRSSGEHSAACDDAWRRVQDFITGRWS
jgi:carboxymethylenebutenolidase